jgi:catechol 2,3-dioxygenase-like lactoylglutathione lyase family enzyme
MRIDHVARVCRDAGATKRFYGELLGLHHEQLDFDGEPMLIFELPGGGSLVFTVRPGAAAPPAGEDEWQHQHVGLTVPSHHELDKWLHRLRAHAIRHQFVDGERIYFADPDGLVLELEVAN